MKASKRSFAASRRNRHQRMRLMLEQLEQRTLFAADLDTNLGQFEPNIVVNPNDPSNIIIAQFNQLTISTDYGVTFPTTITAQLPPALAPGYGFGGDPSMAFDASGNMYWTYLISLDVDGDGNRELADGDDLSVVVQQVNPQTGALIGNAVDVTPGAHTDDKQWIASDANPASPFANNIYLVWTRLDSGSQVMFSRSINNGTTFSAAQDISTPHGGNGFVWPSHLTVAMNGDLYTTWHNDTGGSANATVSVLRDSTGGFDLQNGTVVQSSTFNAAVTTNVQTNPSAVPQTNFWTQGSSQPYILTDPIRPGNVYVVVNDDPDDDFTTFPPPSANDPGDIFIVRSTDYGQTFSAPIRVDNAPAGTFQTMANAAIDELGNIAVSWYDTRSGNTNAGGSLLLDLYAATSLDGGLTWSPDFRINDVQFDPDLNAGTRFNGPPPTLRIGEYNGIAANNGTVFLAWTGNDAGSGIQEVYFDTFNILAPFQEEQEWNNTLPSATVLGSLPAITIDAAINNGIDRDNYLYTAHSTGKVVANLYFNAVSANLLLQLRNSDGTVVSTSVQSHLSDGLDLESLVIPVVAGQRYYYEVLSNDIVVNPTDYTLEIENFATPIPTLVDLSLFSDSGRQNNDDLTNDSTPTLLVHVDTQNFVDPDEDGTLFTTILTPAQFAAHTAGVAVEVFTESGSIGIAAAVPGTQNLFSITSPLLVDGEHAITAAVRINDPYKILSTTAAERNRHSGRGDRSDPLLITIDTIAPAAPTLRLDPAATDTGIPSNPGSYADRVTRATTPGLVGTAEAGSLVRFAADGNPISSNLLDGSDVFGGQTVSVPADFNGNTNPMTGAFRHVLTLNLNDPSQGFPVDGQRQIGATAEDLAGNLSVASFLDILIDTEAARVSAVNFVNGTTVFATKPDLAPSPAASALRVTYTGGPPPAAGLETPAVDEGQATDVRNYRLVGDHVGAVLISSVTLISSSSGAVTVQLNFASPLPDDRFTLTILDTVSDASGNLLDGESQASAPGSAGAVLPSGNRIPGGNFVARFTIDSRPEFGTISQGLVYVDINGNFEWDPTGSDNDATNRDLVFQMGTLTDGHFAGNFAAAGAVVASGFDKLGVYGKFGPTYSFLIDTDDDGVGDFASVMPAAYQVNGIPVAGNFAAGHPGDEIGLFDGQFWYFDANGNNQIDLGERVASNFNGLPIVGDFDGNGQDDFAAYDNSLNRFYFDLNRDGAFDSIWDVRDTTQRFGGLSGFTDRPVAGDVNLDGIDDIGLWVKGRGGQLPSDAGEVFFWVSDRIAPAPSLVFDSFSPAPLGNDLFIQYGDENALPIFGNFDPPIDENRVPRPWVNIVHRSGNPLDVNGDDALSPLDALLVINSLNLGESIPWNDTVRGMASYAFRKIDTNGDVAITPLDALLVINELNRRQGNGEGELSIEGDVATADNSIRLASIDDYFAGLDVDDLSPLGKRRR